MVVKCLGLASDASPVTEGQPARCAARLFPDLRGQNLGSMRTAEEIAMAHTHDTEGIANGHWEHSEPRSAWLLLLARMGVAELRMLSDWARAKTEHSDDREPAGSTPTAH